MATVTLGPTGLAIDGGPCANQDFLINQAGPYGNLVQILMDQRLVGMTEWDYDDWGLEVDRHMPMRANTARNGNITQTKHFRYDVAYDGLLNQDLGRDIMPEFGDYTNNQTLLSSCGLPQVKGLSSTGNMNPEICNPGLDGPMPSVGLEWYGRTATGVRLPIPPLCTGHYLNKEEFGTVLAAVLRSVKNATAMAFRVLQYRWLISQSRYNGVAMRGEIKDGMTKLIDQPGIFKPYKFGYVPTHWGSAAWFASMIQYSEIPRAKSITVSLPPAILEKYKQDYMRANGFNLWAEAQNITKNINGYIAQALQETLVYTHPTTGQRIIFEASQNPVYVEVTELGPETGTWEFQEKWVARDSEQNGQIFRRPNPNWGRQCACPGKVLAAIVTVTADDGEKPFYKEPLPNNNPSADIRGIVSRFASGQGVKLNSNLAEFYPSVETTTILTGLEAQIYLLDPANRRAAAAGMNCDTIASNLKNSWFGGFTEIFSQFVANAPRQIANFLLLMPKLDMCSIAPVYCEEPDALPASGDIDPLINPLIKQPVPVPEPVPPPTPTAGTIFMSGQVTRVTAPCTGTKTVSFQLLRKGGSAGALAVTLSATPSAHGGTPPTPINFADGETVKTVSWTIPAWNNTDPDTAAESYVITLTGLDPDSYQTRTICIKPPLCTGVCDVNTGDCNSCGTT